MDSGGEVGVGEWVRQSADISKLQTGELISRTGNALSGVLQFALKSLVDYLIAQVTDNRNRSENVFREEECGF